MAKVIGFDIPPTMLAIADGRSRRPTAALPGPGFMGAIRRRLIDRHSLPPLTRPYSVISKQGNNK
jgi:hypothetical protein